MTGSSVGVAVWIAAMAAIMPVPVAMVAADCGVDVCVSLLPDMKALICFLAPSVWNGDSGA